MRLRCLPATARPRPPTFADRPACCRVRRPPCLRSPCLAFVFLPSFASFSSSTFSLPFELLTARIRNGALASPASWLVFRDFSRPMSAHFAANVPAETPQGFQASFTVESSSLRPPQPCPKVTLRFPPLKVHIRRVSLLSSVVTQGLDANLASKPAAAQGTHTVYN